MKVLVTSKSFGKNNKAALRLLEDNGFSIVWGSKPSMTAAEIAREIPGMDALLVGNDTVDRNVFDAADRLKLVHMHGTGLDGIDVAYATTKGILVANAPGANSNAVAEMTVALMLTAGRRIDRHSALLREGRWERTAGHEVSRATVGLIGLGNIGRRIVSLLRGFETPIIAFDPMADERWVAEHEVRLVTRVDEVFQAADFLVLALPLTPATHHLVNDRTLGLMKPTAYIVNTARGGLIDDDALCRAISEKRLFGAALDTFADEPLPLDSPLRRADIVITPHLAATSIESAAKVSGIVADNIVAILKHGQKERAINHAAKGMRF